ncbi:histidinol dehydrogenase, partial [archaeon]|nr:histidinol dehydrogenase [archaeon]
MRQITDPDEVLEGRWPNVSASDRELLDYVKPIVDDVAERGDQAVTEYTEKFDKVRLESFKVTQEEIQEAYKLVSQSEVQALRESRRRLELVESQ